MDKRTAAESSYSTFIACAGLPIILERGGHWLPAEIVYCQFSNFISGTNWVLAHYRHERHIAYFIVLPPPDLRALMFILIFGFFPYLLIFMRWLKMSDPIPCMLVYTQAYNAIAYALLSYFPKYRQFSFSFNPFYFLGTNDGHCNIIFMSIMSTSMAVFESGI